MMLEIERMNRDYCASYNDGDLDGLSCYLADDALTLSPDQPPVQGRAAHRDYFAAALRRESRRRLSLVSLRGEGAGALHYDAGTWENTVTSEDGSEARLRGYYLATYRRDGDGWKMVTMMFNVSM